MRRLLWSVLLISAIRTDARTYHYHTCSTSNDTYSVLTCTYLYLLCTYSVLCNGTYSVLSVDRLTDKFNDLLPFVNVLSQLPL